MAVTELPHVYHPSKIEMLRYYWPTRIKEEFAPKGFSLGSASLALAGMDSSCSRNAWSI